MLSPDKNLTSCDFLDPAVAPTASSIWGLMSQEDIEEGLIEILSSDYEMAKGVKVKLLSKLAPMMGFRPDSLLKASAEANLQKLRKRIHSRDFEIFRDDIVCHWLIRGHRLMLIDFLDACSVPHSDGFVSDDYHEPPSEEALTRAIKVISSRYQFRPVMIYLGYFYVWGTEFWHEIAPAFHLSENVLKAARENDLRTEPTTGNEKETGKSSAPIAQEHLPETSDRFTPLDNILIRSIVATAADEIGSLPQDELEAFVEEVVGLNAKRSHSVFHRGFFDALFSQKTEYNSAAENSERRMWYLTGLLMGMLRKGKTAEILSLIKLKKEIFREICADSKSRCGMMLLPNLFPIFWECDESEAAFELLRGQLVRLPERQRMRMAIDVYENAKSLLRKGNAEISGNFLDLLNRLVSAEGNFTDEFKEYFIQRNDRRRAQVFMAKGEFPAALKLLKPLVVAEDDELAAEAAGDVALVKGSIRSLQSLFPLNSPENASATANALKSGLPELELSVAKDAKGSTNARILLGIGSLFAPSRDPHRALDEFRSALAGMMDRASLYEAGGVLQWVRLLHGMAILENSDEGGLFQVRDLLKCIRESGEKYPMWILRRMLEASTQFDDKSVAVALADMMLAQEGNKAFDAIWQSKLPLEVPELGQRYTEWMLATEGSSKAKWPRCMELLRFMLREQKYEVAADLLDAMEIIAFSSNQCAGELIELLDDDGNYAPAWDFEDAELSRINLAEKSGRIEEARALLVTRYYSKRSSENPRDIEEAEGILEWLKELNEDPGQLETLSKLLQSEEANHDNPPGAIQEVYGKILFVGGNETQAQYRDEVIREVKKSCPHLEIDFINPGWSSNWNKHLADVRQQLPSMEAVVLSPLVRTQLGRSIRKECDDAKPWFPCTGRGKASIVRSVLNAARWMAAR
jgi:hypothetical protein